MKKYKASIPYEDFLDEELKDPKKAMLYLDACLEDSEHPEVFLTALRDVARAWGVAEIAEQTGLNRESMYRMLSEKGNPAYTSLIAILDAMNLRLSIKPKKKTAKGSK